MRRFPVTLGSLAQGDRFQFNGSMTLTGTVGERQMDGVAVFLDTTRQEYARRRRRPKLEVWHEGTRVRKL